MSWALDARIWPLTARGLFPKIPDMLLSVPSAGTVMAAFLPERSFINDTVTYVEVGSSGAAEMDAAKRPTRTASVDFMLMFEWCGNCWRKLTFRWRLRGLDETVYCLNVKLI